jgi:hypothetical protein
MNEDIEPHTDEEEDAALPEPDEDLELPCIDADDPANS